MRRTIAAMTVWAVLPATVSACPNDMVAVTKEGHFGAATTSGYRELVLLQTRRHTGELLDQVKSGQFIRLPGREEVCIKDSTRFSYRTKITIPGRDGVYWVHLNALDW